MAAESSSGAGFSHVVAGIGGAGGAWAGAPRFVEWAYMSVSGLKSRAGAAAKAAGALSCAGALALSGCAQTPARVSARSHSKEYFSTAVYGTASPRMVGDGQPVPKGGGQYLVGHPYRIAGKTYYPAENPHYSAVGLASWYGDAFHGRRTANGEVYDMHSLTAAHPTMPLPSYARVTNLTNGYSVIVRVNDRGPYHGGRVMDVSSRVADVLDFKGAGTAQNQGRLRRRCADGRFGRQSAARQPAYRWGRRPSRWLCRGDYGRRRCAHRAAVLAILVGSRAGARAPRPRRDRSPNPWPRQRRPSRTASRRRRPLPSRRGPDWLIRLCRRSDRSISARRARTR